MRVTFQAGVNNTTNGTALGAAGEDVVVHKVIIGLPVASADLRLYTSTNPVNESATDLAWFMTLPATLGGSSQSYPFETVIDFGPQGLPLRDGGNFQQDQICNTTIIWGLKGEV